MKKKLLVALMVASTISVLVYFASQRELIEKDEVSQRGNDFISERISNGDEFWKAQQFTPASKILGISSIQTPCIAVTLPFEVLVQSKTQTDDSCTVKGKILTFIGRMSLHAKKSDGPLAENANVALRIREPTTYVLIEKGDNWFLYEEPSSVTLFAARKGYHVSVSLTGLQNPKAAIQHALSVQSSLQ